MKKDQIGSWLKYPVLSFNWWGNGGSAICTEAKQPKLWWRSLRLSLESAFLSRFSA